MVAFIVVGANLRCFDAPCQRMTAWAIGSIVSANQVLDPSGGHLFGVQFRINFHGFPHGLVESAGMAVECVIANPVVDHSRLHPYAAIFGDVKTSHPLFLGLCWS